jgi:hypothetical protein
MKTSKTDLSVVIVTYNNRDLILTCLRRLARALEPHPHEVIVIDNASTDGTGSLLQEKTPELNSMFDTLRVMYNKNNSGYTAGVNQGLAHTSAAFVLLLNPDVLLQPDTLHPLLEFLQHHPETGVVAPQLRYPDQSIQPSCRRFPRKRDVLYSIFGLGIFFSHPEFNAWKMDDFDHTNARPVDQPQGAFILTRRQVLNQIGPLDERFVMFFSDVEWCARVKRAGWHIWFLPRAVAIHVKGASIRTRRLSMIVSSHRSFVQYFTMQDTTLSDRFGTILVLLALLILTLPRLMMAGRLGVSSGKSSPGFSSK